MRSTGVHISGQVIRLAELDARAGGSRVVRLETLPWPDLSITAAAAPERNGGICVSALPAGEVLTRVWTFPPVAPAKLRALVQMRLEADLPIPLDELQWDCRTATNRQSAQISVLAQAVRRERVARHIEALRSAKFTPGTVTTEAEAVASLAFHALGFEPAPTLTALVLASEKEWLLAILEGELARMVRRVAFDPDSPQSAVGEARQIIQTQRAETALTRIAWLGDASAAEPLADLADLLEVPLSTAVAGLRHASGEPVAPEDVARYAPALGLALAGQQPCEHVLRLGGALAETAYTAHGRLEALLRRPRRLAIAAGVGLVLAACIHLAALRSETSRMQATLSVAANRPADDLDVKVRSMQRLTQYRLDVEGIMAEIARVLPDSILISSVQLSRDRRLVLKGTSRDAKAAFTLADVLSKSPRFVNVQPERAAPAQGGEFTVTADVSGIQKFTSQTGGRARWR